MESEMPIHLSPINASTFIPALLAWLLGLEVKAQPIGPSCASNTSFLLTRIQEGSR